ncbi:PadR family transcriptional regulator [Fodinicola acaciae]|uniref:PadR family transcriptional regulator n=1 Tax=Fodinicola acaciae TaxID=2681555 RepID=UPI001C9E24B6|nr:helix-turn-helix transcriptional regulator [Fodinicola acaciae]
MTPAIFALLLALAGGERHGYALMSDVAALTGGLVQLGPGTLYRSLQRMRVDGLITEIDDDEEPAEEPADRRSERRRRYQITDLGRQAAAQEAGRLAVLLAAARARGIQPVEILHRKVTG